MKALVRYLGLALVFFLCCVDVYAADRIFTWSNPIANTDGSVLDQTTLTTYDIGCASIDGGPYQVLDTFQATDPLPVSHALALAPGDYWCVIRVSTSDQVSDWSNVVFFTIVTPTPAAIDDLSVD